MWSKRSHRIETGNNVVLEIDKERIKYYQDCLRQMDIKFRTYKNIQK